MVTGRKNTVNWLQALTELNHPYWTIYWKGKTDSGHFVAKSSQAEGLTMTESIDDLRQRLDNISYGQYTIVAQKSNGNVGKGSAREDFEITATEAQPVAGIGSVPHPSSMAGYVTEEKAMQMAEKKFEELMLKKDLADTKAQLATVTKEKRELEKDANEGTNKIVNMIAGIVMPMLQPGSAQVGTLGMTLPPPPAQNVIKETVAEEEDTMTTEEQQQMAERLTAVLNDCTELFGEPAIPFLEKLMAKVKTAPYLVDVVKGAIK